MKRKKKAGYKQIYLAGNPGTEKNADLLIKHIRSWMLSYWDIKIETFRAGDYAFKIITDSKMKRRKNKVNLFLDSGAFSAYTQGVEIDIQEYIDFIKEHEEIIEIYANLDVISASKIGNEESAKKTWENQKIMEDAGLKPLPVFHYGEPEKYLIRYVKNYDYVSLGGMVPISNTQLIPWLDKLWSKYLTDEKGMPKVKVHGFGLTSLKLMLRYPWYSVDSTSWVVTGRLGSIFVPRYRNNKWIYDENSWKISVSNQSPNRKEAGKHIDTLPPKIRNIILDYIHAKGYVLGKSEFKKVNKDHELAKNERWAEPKKDVTGDKRLLEILVEPGISNKYQLRDEMNIIYFLDLEENMPKWPWKFKKQNTMKPLI